MGIGAKRIARTMTPVTFRNARSVEVEDAAAGLMVAEYASIRAEALESFSTAQSIIQWSLATYGVLFGAGLLAASSQIAAVFSSTASWMAALIYGALLPGLVCAASWSWIGETRRMERTGAFLRGFERRVHAETSKSRSSIIGPLNWEAFLAGSRSHPAAPVKGWAPYLGTSMLFGGSLAASVAFFYIWADRLVSMSGRSAGMWVLIGINLGMVSLFVGVSIHAGIGVVRLGNQYFDFETHTLKWLREPARNYGLWEVVLYVSVVVVVIALGLLLIPGTILPWKS